MNTLDTIDYAIGQHMDYAIGQHMAFLFISHLGKTEAC